MKLDCRNSNTLLTFKVIKNKIKNNKFKQILFKMNVIEAIPIETPLPILRPIQPRPAPIILNITPILYKLYIERIKNNNKKGEEYIEYTQIFHKNYTEIKFIVHFYEGLHYTGYYNIASTDKLKEFRYSDARYINSIHINIITENTSKTFIFTKAMIGKCRVDDIADGGKISIIPNTDHKYIRRNRTEEDQRRREEERRRREEEQRRRPTIINGIIQPLF